MTRSTLARALALLGLAAVLVATLTPLPTQTASSNRTAWWCLVCGEVGVVDVLQNVLLFMPLGLALRLLGWRTARTVLAGAMLSLSVELLQRYVIVGRDPSLGDLLSNSVGAWAGAAVAGVLPLLLLPSAHAARRLAIGWGLCCLAALAGAACAFRPYAPPEGPYFTLLAHRFPTRGHFLGTLASATLDRQPLADAEVFAHQPLAAMLGASEHRIAAELVTGPAPAQPAPIVQVVGQSNFVIAELNQHRARLIYLPPADAARLRFRRTAVKLDDALPITAGTSARVTGGLEGGALFVAVETAAGSRVERYPLTANLGWNLLTGFALKTAGPGPWLTACFVALWCTPLLVWSRRGWGDRWVVPTAVAACIGATLASRLAGLAWPPAWELVGYGVALLLSQLWRRVRLTTEMLAPAR